MRTDGQGGSGRGVRGGMKKGEGEGRRILEDPPQLVLYVVSGEERPSSVSQLCHTHHITL